MKKIEKVVLEIKQPFCLYSPKTGLISMQSAGVHYIEDFSHRFKRVPHISNKKPTEVLLA